MVPVLLIAGSALAERGLWGKARQLLETAAAWVRYANRVKDYGVKYWEIGNESWLNNEIWKNPIAPATYAADLVTFIAAMGVLVLTFDDDRALRPRAVEFMEEIARWVEKFEPKAIIAERFQTRGNGGPLIEMVSVMLGLLAGKYETLPVKLITASTWKNAFNRRHQCDLREMYPDVLTPPHAFDSCLIGIYGLEYGTQQQLEYSPSQLMRMAERTSCLPLRKKKE